MKYKVGEFVFYNNKELNIRENCLIVSIHNYSYKLRTIEVLDDNVCIRYFDDDHFNAMDKLLIPITDENTLSRLRKIIIFK